MPFPKVLDDLKFAGYRFEGEGVCAGCHSDIEWWLTPAGKKMPMDPMSRGTSQVLPHWSSCPNAGQFRKGK